jgi:ribosomal-protein-alanine N-acetyltransferase
MINTTVLSPFPIIETERLILRKVTLDDANDLFAIRSDIRVVRYLGRDRNINIDETITNINLLEAMLNNEEGIRWGITLKPSDKLIGSIGFWRLNKPHFRAEIGYDLHPDFWNKGIMTEAIKLVSNFGFQKMNLHSIEANTDKDNIATQKVLVKNGFVKEAHFKENYYYNGKFLDSVIFSLIQPK